MKPRILLVLAAGLFLPQSLKVDVQLVNIVATVQDAAGHFVTGLRRGDFRVYEDDVLQDVRLFERQDGVESTVGLLVDTSGSMADILPLMTSGVREFAASLGEGDEHFVMVFGSEVTLIHDVGQSLRHLEASLKGARAWGTSVFYDALHFGLEKVREGKQERKALIVLTDGNDNGSRIERRTILAEAERGGVLLYFVAVGPAAVNDMRTLEDLSSRTAGRAVLVRQDFPIASVISEIRDELRNQYYLAYYVEPRPGYHRIRVEIPGKTYKIRAKPGYVN